MQTKKNDARFILLVSIEVLFCILGFVAAFILFVKNKESSLSIIVAIASLAAVTVIIFSNIILYGKVKSEKQHCMDLMEKNDVDELTGLLNCSAFIRDAEMMIHNAEIGSYAVACLDIDRFKEFNDRFGYQEGNRLLKFIGDGGKRFAKKFEPCIVSRVYADRFFVLVKSDINFEDVEKIFDKYMEDFESPFKVNYHCGIYIVENRSLIFIQCMDNALSAMKHSKNFHGKNISFFDKSIHEKWLRKQLIIDSAAKALAENQFEPYFQPKYHYSVGKIIGAEALVRWNHPELGLLMPGEFIPVFEEFGFIRKLTEYMLENVCVYINEWKSKNLPVMPISINLSRADICDMEPEKFAERLNNIVKSHGLTPEVIHFELSETSYEDCPERFQFLTKKLHDYGYKIELDDFGTAFSFAKILMSFPIDLIKIDRSVVLAAENNYRNSIVLSMLIRMSHWLGIPVIAEGVENKNIADSICAMDCKLMQGYLFAKPQSAESFESFLSANKIEKLSISYKDLYPAVAFDSSLVGDAFDILLATKDLDLAMNNLLEMLGMFYKIDHIYIAEETDDHEHLFLAYEWCGEGIESPLSKLKKISYEELGFKTSDFFVDTGLISFSDVSAISSELAKKWFDRIGTVASIQAALYIKNIFVGLIAFDMKSRFEWKGEQIGTIRMISRIIASLLSARILEKGMEFVDDYQKIIECSNDLIYIVDKEYNVLYNNRTTVKLFGDCRGKKCYECFCGLQSMCGKCPVKNFDENAPVPVRVGFAKNVNVVASASPVRYHDMDCMFVTAKDVTPLDDAVRKSYAKSTFLSAMSHDIRTPMNAISGFVDIALRNKDDSDVMLDSLNKIRTSSDHLISLVNDILDVSAIENGKLKIRSAVYNIKSGFEQYRTMFQSLFESKNQKVIFNMHDIEAQYVKADDVHLRQIFNNLLSNAHKYTPSGGEVTFEFFQRHSEDGKLETVGIIKDNGIGMNDEFMKNMWNSYSRSSDDRINHIQGTGLGLAIVKNLVELMGGTIDVSSALNEGTCFTVVLPLEAAENPIDDSSDSTEIDMKNRHINVLVAEDNDINWEIISRLLVMYGISCTHAKNGKICAEMFKNVPEGEYDAIFMDMQMPVMNGLDATREIRSSGHPDAKKIPIIAMTANAFSDDISQCLEVGMNEHLSKPVEINKILSILKKYTN